MSAATVLLLRHGQTEWNATGRMQGQSDIELDAVGREQAVRAAEVVASFGPTAVVASDLRRAADTAAALGAAAGLPVVADVRLRERGFGTWEGLTRDEIVAQWPEEFSLWAGGGQPSGTGMESRTEVGERFAAAVVEHAEALAPEATLVVVTHGGAISAGASTLLGLDPGAWNGLSGIGNCHWTVLHRTVSGTPAWRLHAHNVGAAG